MGQKDLGTCVILCKEDISKLNIRMDSLEHISDFNTPEVSGFSDQGKRRKLRSYIEKEARKCYADIALITLESSGSSSVEYSYSLYKYNNNK
jgi:hypothetical protein